MIVSFNLVKLYSNQSCFEPKNISKQSILVQNNNFAEIYNQKTLSKISFTGKTDKKELTRSQIIELKHDMASYPKDVEYRKKMARNMGLNENEYYRLNSIIGGEELVELMQEYTKDEFNNKDVKNILPKNIKFIEKSGHRANFHNHTNFSDGCMTVKELIEQAREYADRLDEILPDSAKRRKTPYVIGITDHDTIDGTKEALKILSSDPWKYRNLKVILGAELLIHDRTLQKEIQKPIRYEILAMGIDPNEQTINTFINTKKHNREEFTKKMISYANTAYNYFFEDNDVFSLEEAKRLQNTLDKNILRTKDYTIDYIKFKRVLQERFIENKKFKEVFKKKKIDLNSPKEQLLLKQYFHDHRKNWGFEYYKNYEPHMVNYISERTGFSREKVKSILDKKPESLETQEFFKLINKHFEKYNPNITKHQPYYAFLSETMDELTKMPEVVIGISHPAIITAKSKINGEEEGILRPLFINFKEKGGKQSIFAEAYYQSYDNASLIKLDPTEEPQKTIEEIMGRLHLLKTGSVDVHGNSIFKRK